jgi:hypothetical protein
LAGSAGRVASAAAGSVTSATAPSVGAMPRSLTWCVEIISLEHSSLPGRLRKVVGFTAYLRN